jgi:glycosyltransferase involved in cell wall biosynthesis
MTPSAPIDELVLLMSLGASRGPRGGLVVTQKYLNGAAEYARRWPGHVTSLAIPCQTLSTDMDHIEALPDELTMGLELRPDSTQALGERLRSAAVVLAFLSPQEAPTAQLCRELGVPLVFYSEFSLNTELQIVAASTKNPFRRWRKSYWHRRAESIRIRALTEAAGLQCSGTPTYDSYRELNRDVMLFFDNRVPAGDVITNGELEARLSGLGTGTPLRLVFGGRFIAMKGVMHLPEVAHELRALGVDFTLDIVGGGPLETELRQRIDRLRLADFVRLRGPMDFATGWVPFLKRETDLFVCCHPQGDPSSTYYETMSCGTPVVGFANEAFAGTVAASGSGWLTPLGDARALAERIATLDKDRGSIATAARKAREFGNEHSFEKTFRRRTEHLIRLSRLAEDTKREQLESMT